MNSKFLRVVNCTDCDQVVLKLTEGSLLAKGISVRCSDCEQHLGQKALWNNALEDKFVENFYPQNKNTKRVFC